MWSYFWTSISCSNVSSLTSMFVGLKYAAMQVQMGCNQSMFCDLHHLFFIVGKLLNEAVIFPQQELNEKLTQISNLKLSSDGGFLRQPCSDVSAVEVPKQSSGVEYVQSWNKFCCLISTAIWPSMQKCLLEGKKFIDSKKCQMTCVRLLEILPLLFEWITKSCPQNSQNLKTPTIGFTDFTWLINLVDWGRSSLVVITRRWKQSILYIMNLLRNFLGVSKSSIAAIEKTMYCDSILIDELKVLVSEISLSLSKKPIFTSPGDTSKTTPSVSTTFYLSKEPLAAETSIGEKKSSQNDLLLTVTENVGNKDKDTIVIISDDEDEKISPIQKIISPSIECHENNGVYADKSISYLQTRAQDSVTDHAPVDSIKNSTHTKNHDEIGNVFSQESSKVHDKSSSSKVLSSAAASLVNSRNDDGKTEMTNSKFIGNPLLVVKNVPALGSSYGKSVINETTKQDLTSRKLYPDKDPSVSREGRSAINKNTSDFATVSARPSNLLPTKPLISVPKRKVVQLQMPTSNKFEHPSRVSIKSRNFKPPKLDNWYTPILELDYFSLINSYSGKQDDNVTATMKSVPLCFHSKEHYMEIFRPLVLEEFKAQLHSTYIESSSSEDMCSGVLCVLSVERIDDFHLVRGSPEKCELSASRDYSENDLLLFTKEPLKNSENIYQPLHIIGKVERHERNNKTRVSILSIRVYLQSALPRLIKVKKFLTERSKWHISRLLNMTSQLREFQALSSLDNIPLLPLILNPTDSAFNYADTNKDKIDTLPEPMKRTLKSSFNGSQIKAINVAIGSRGCNRAFELSLIQGPPGTGKTRTIVAIVSALLSLGSSEDVFPLASNNNQNSNDCAFISQSAAIARAWQDAALAKQINMDSVKPAPVSRSLKRRVLICAQSNAAVDELVSRLNSGLCGSDGKAYRPFLVRVGNVKTVHPNSLPFFIDTLVEQRLTEDKSANDRKKDVNMDASLLRTKLEKIVDNIRLYEAKRAKARDSDTEIRIPQDENPNVNVKEISDAEIGAKLNSLYAQKKSICGDIAIAQVQERKFFEENKQLKNKIRKSIIKEAEIVVTTLNGCGGDIYGVCSDYASTAKFGKFSENSLFDAIVIDEAAQALEPATLIPLQLLKSNGTKCVMVGDPKQLPATVLSKVASKYLYECSMFERLQRAGYPVTMLSEQYRMHPEICKFPSCHFYDKKLLTGSNMICKPAPFHENVFLGPYLFFDIVDGRECQGRKSGSLSLYNEAEAEAAVEILKFLRKKYASEFFAAKIGIIAPYKSQISVLRSRCSKEFETAVGNMEFNTVDGFQGREVDILILSTVRASSPIVGKSSINSRRIGFVADVRRMNVALTRAKLSLWIFGNSMTLQTNAHWDSLIKDAKGRNLFMFLSRPYNSCLKKSPLLNDKNRPNSHHSHSRCHEDEMPQAQCDEYKEGEAKTLGLDQGKHKVKHDDRYKKQTLSHVDPSAEHQVSRNQKVSTFSLTCEPREKVDGEGKLNQKKNLEDADGKHTKREKIKCIEKDSGPKIKQKKGKAGHETAVSSLSDTTQKRHNVIDNHHVPMASHMKDDDNHGNSQKSLLATRKRQREAVESLLSSSLVSSKKPGDSSKTCVRKPVSQAICDGEAIIPAKPSKGGSNNSKRRFVG